MKIFENNNFKLVRSKNYNYNFNKKNGFFMRWGKDKEDDPLFSPFGPEIADIEVTTICHGIGGKLCEFCYKANTPKGKNMSLETFKELFHKLGRGLVQIAFGVDSKAESNPDLWKMMDYCRNNDYNYVVPNITVAEISSEIADKLVKHCGAVAVSRSADKNYCYDGAKKLTDRGMEQTNIHIMISEETYEQAVETINDRLLDKRLEKLNAIVFLSLKQMGRGKNFTPLSKEKFRTLIDLAFEKKIDIGFDSCSALKFLDAIKERKDYKQLEMTVEPCESFGVFSAYFNVDAVYFPCSFAEGCGDWKQGINVLECNDFLKDIWFHKKVNKYRKISLDCGRKCPLFEI